MSAYDTRPIMLDAGRTSLALRGLRRTDGHYPFLGDVPQRREAARARTVTLAAWLSRVQELLGRRRLRSIESPTA